MFHGGTNFGFMNGAMHFHDYKSDVTSYGKYSSTLPSLVCSAWAWLGLAVERPSGSTSGTFSVFGNRVPGEDYDAVLTEAGDYTAKYMKLRDFFGSISGIPLPPPPDLIPKMSYEPITPVLYLSLWDALKYMGEVSAGGSCGGSMAQNPFRQGVWERKASA
ncbi:Beta-galactosidase-1-like protein 2 [Saguinus oedipus]|uniref:Beta-galactosidase-1-like protein 2 n=1 Tax=Saguinus oedipus TaxID=9490 RepID=A0ABQ9US21_SAGOE|nr:Beta-galactosidase-1-like protein 2 [Saguinus oedipus]